MSSNGDDYVIATCKLMNSYLAYLIDVIGSLEIEENTWRYTKLELEKVRDMKASAIGLECKLCLFFYSLSMEPRMQALFEKSDKVLLDDLKNRVFPLLIPRLVRNVGQRPDAFLSSLVVMTEMWPGVAFSLSPKWEGVQEGVQGGVQEGGVGAGDGMWDDV